MAKYTILYGDYINNGGTQPAVFANIQGFADLFLAHFCDKEIGFETEELFNIKLNAYAEIIIPRYKDRIDLLVAFMTNAKGNPTKTHYESHNLTYAQGEQTTDTTELPINATTAEPSLKNKQSGRTDLQSELRTIQDYGQSTEEVLKFIEDLNGKVQILLWNCLSEFDNLFMKVY